MSIPKFRQAKVGADQFQCLRCGGWHDIVTAPVAAGGTHRPKVTKTSGMEDFYYCHDTKRGFYARSYGAYCKEKRR